MNKRFLKPAVVVFLVVFAAVVVGLAAFSEHQYTALKTPGLVLTTQVLPGQRVTSADVAKVNIALGGQPVVLISSLPRDTIAAIPLNPGTLLQASDFVNQSLAQVEIAVQHTPTIVAGDTLDLYLNNTGANLTSTPTSTNSTVNGVILLGVGVPVTAVSGSNVTILVPFSEASYWAAVSASQPQLVAVIATTAASPQNPQTGLSTALRQLESSAGAPSGG